MFGFFRSVAEGRVVLARDSVKSAMTPIFWVCAVVTPTCLFAAWLLEKREAIVWVLVCTAILPPLAAVGVFVYFAVRDPKRLHSEEHIQREHALQIAESKGGQFSISPLDLPSIANPYPSPKAIEHRPPPAPEGTPPDKTNGPDNGDSDEGEGAGA